MRRIFAFVLFFVGLAGMAKADILPEKFEKSTFYSVMQTGDLDAINHEIEVVKASGLNEKDGYEGALLIKKAGLLKKPKDRLSTFKEGRIKLETAILNDNENIEFHFLRLTIEEHAPKIVKYHSDIENDKALVVKNYKNLQPVVQRAVLDYSKNSKVLHPEEL